MLLCGGKYAASWAESTGGLVQYGYGVIGWYTSIIAVFACGHELSDIHNVGAFARVVFRLCIKVL